MGGVAKDDTYDVYANVRLRIPPALGVLNNDSLPAGSVVSVDQNPSHGTLTFHSDGSFEYLPNTGFVGDDSFTYSYTGTDGNLVDTTVNLNVAGNFAAEPFDIPSDYAVSYDYHSLILGDAAPLADGDFVQAHIAKTGSSLTLEVSRYDDDGKADSATGPTVLNLAGILAVPVTADEGGRSYEGTTNAVSLDNDEIAIAFSGYGEATKDDTDPSADVDNSRGALVEKDTVVIYDSDNKTFDIIYQSDRSASTYSAVLLNDHVSTIVDVEGLGSNRVGILVLADSGSSAGEELRVFSSDGKLVFSHVFSDDAGKIIGTGDGGAIVVNTKSTTDGNEVYEFTKLSPTGAATDLFSVNGYFAAYDDNTGADQIRSKNVSILGNGNIAVAYTNFADETYQPAYELHSADGKLLAKHYFAAPTGDTHIDKIDITALSNGIQLLAWSNEVQDTSTETVDVHYQLLATDGSLIGSVVNAGNFSGEEDGSDEGSSLVTSDGTSFLLTPGNNSGVVVAADGSVLQSAFRLTADAEPDAYVRATPNPDGSILLQWGTGSREIWLDAPQLFTSGQDVVNFNNLGSKSQALTDVIESGSITSVYNALSGADTVILPNTETVLPDGLHWSYGQVFEAGAGNDTITSSDGDDNIDGGADNDTIIGSVGNDIISGGDGADTFDYSAVPLTTLTAGMVAKIDGGKANDTIATVNASADTIKLSGSPSDYIFKVVYPQSGDMRPHTLITLKTGGGGTIDTVGVLKATFATPVDTDNTVKSSNTLLEMAQLASDAYGAAKFPQTAEPLASTGVSTASVTAAAMARGWHPLSAIELGLSAENSTPTGFSYAFSNGVYQATNLNDEVSGDPSEADALVLTGIVGSKVTLTIAFRGTDQYADFADYINFGDHYAKFQPLINAIDAYIKNTNNGIQQVLVEGHSLGGAMVQHFMAEHPSSSFPGVIFEALTIGSPGDDLGAGTTDNRIVNFADSQDPIAAVPYFSSASPSVRAGLALVTGSVSGVSPIASVLTQIFSSAIPKHLAGSRVLIDTDASETLFNPYLTEHDKSLYLAELQELVYYAGKSSMFAQSALAKSLLDGSIYTGSPVEVALPIPGRIDALITSKVGDNFVFGTVGDDAIVWTNEVDLAAQNGNPERYINGEGGSDSLLLMGLPLLWSTAADATGYNLSYSGKVVGHLEGVQTLKFLNFFLSSRDVSAESVRGSATADSPIDSPVVHLDGSPATVQTPTAGATDVTVDHSYDYFDAGSANIAIHSTTTDDFVVLGSGAQTFDDAGGNDTILVRPDAAGVAEAPLLVTPGAGDDIVVGDASDWGRLTVTYSGSLSNYDVAHNADGSITIEDMRTDSPDGTDRIEDVGQVRFANGTVVMTAGNALVDSFFYDQKYSDILAAGVDPAAHYNAFGWHEGRDPDAYFSTDGYLAANPDVLAAGANPLMQYDQYGWHEGRDPSANFDTTLYLLHNPDVAAAGVDPLTHYLAYGQAEGRQAYAAIGTTIYADGFDPEYYLLSNPDVAAAAVASGGDVDQFAYQHYEAIGWKEGRNPNAWFDDAGYLAAYSDVKAAGINPLDHYDQFGWKEGRDPSAAFDTNQYLAHNPDVAAAGVDPLVHYLDHGAYEMRATYADNAFGHA